MKKRLLSMILALGMMLTILPVNAITAWAENGKIIQSGNCGNNVTYNLTQNNDDDADKTYTLTISGNGEMNNYSDYNFGNSPWANVASAITQVVFEGDITTIGNYSFYRCTRLTSITIPNSVISIGNGAFFDCMNLQKITMPDDSNSELQSIGAFAFENCYNLTSITIPSSVQSIGKHAFYLSVGSLKVYWPTVLSDHITVDDELGYNATYYYPGYKSAWDVQKSKISNFRGLDDVHYYCDVTIDANGGSFSDGTKTKVVKKVWSKEKLTQEQVEAIGVPQNAQKAFYGWKYIGFYTERTDNLEDVVIKDSMTFYADYIGNTVTLGQLNNDNELVKGNSYEFTVTIKAYSADSGSPTKKLTFGDVAGTIKDKNGKTVGAEGLEVTLPDGGEKTLTFTFTPNEVGQNKTLTAYLDGLKYKEEEYGPVTSSTTYSVRDRQNAEVTIDGLDGTTVKAGEAKDFTVNVTPNDDTIDKVTFGTTSGEVQWSSDGGNTWTTVPDDVDYNGLTGKKFRVVPAADAANGTVTVTVTAKKADDTEVARKDASFTVTAREHATVAINNLNGETITQNKPHTFTVTVTAHDDSGNAILTFDNVAGLTYNGTAVTDAGVTVTLTNQPAPLTFTLTPDAEGAGKTLTATLDNGAMDTATYTVSEYEHAKVTIDGLDTDLKQGESKNFTVTVDPKDDSGDATIDFGNKNSEIQYKDGEDWKSMPSDGLKIDLNNGKKPYDFRITPKNDGENQKLTATVKKENTKLGEAEKSYNVSKYVDAVVKIDGLSGTVETDTEKEFTVTVTANDDAGKNVTAKAGFTGPAGATITLKKVQYRFGDSGEWQELNGMNLDINSLELPFNSLRNITYKLTVTFAEAGNYKFDVSLTKEDAAKAFTSDSAEVTVTKKKEPVTPGGGSTGGGEKPGENPGSGSTGGGENPGENPGSGSTGGSENPGENPGGSTTPKRKLEIADGTLTSVTVKDKNGNLKDITDTITKDLDGKYEIPVGAKVTITAKDAPEGMKFGEWSISDKTLLSDPDVPYTEKDLIFTMPDNSDGVKLSVVYLEESIGEEPNLVEKGALAGTVVVGSAALLYQGHMLGTELYLRYLLPHGAVIPQNRAELAVLLWQDAENPEPVSTTLYSDISDEDSAIQQAARWAVENDLMEQLDAEEHPDHFDPFVPVTFSDSIRAWKKAQELKKSVH